MKKIYSFLKSYLILKLIIFILINSGISLLLMLGFLIKKINLLVSDCVYKVLLNYLNINLIWCLDVFVGLITILFIGYSFYKLINWIITLRKYDNKNFVYTNLREKENGKSNY